MKKKWGQAVFLATMLILGVASCTVSNAAEGDIAITAETFPDAHFREAVMQCDADNNNVLSVGERSGIRKIRVAYDTKERGFTSKGKEASGVYVNLHNSATGRTKDYLDIVWWEDGTPEISVEGIGYFPNLEEYVVEATSAYVKGSLQQNKKLTKVTLKCKEDETDIGKTMSNRFAVENLEYIKLKFAGAEKYQWTVKGTKKLKKLVLEKMQLKKFQLSGGKKLATLKITGGAVETFDVVKGKQLRHITLDNVDTSRLDLRKNKKLRTVRVLNGQKMQRAKAVEGYFKGDEPQYVSVGERYYSNISRACQLLLPKNNKIEEIEYFTTDKTLDISRCKKIASVSVPKNTKVKVNRKWYQKTGKKQLWFVFDGVAKNKASIPKKGKYIYISKAIVK